MDFQFIKSQFTGLPVPTDSFQDQTVIVTGANVGLGLEAARHFAGLGAAKVILACRSIAKGEEACRSIEQSTGRKGVCETWALDLSNFDSVKEFTLKAALLERLDIVVENAGVAVVEYQQAEGMELTVAVNVVGTFLMALNVLPTLRKSATKTGLVPRLVIVSSEVHAMSKMAERHGESIFETLKENKKEYMDDRYATSKLLEVLTVRKLAAQMQSGPHASQPVILNAINPGLCHSALTRNISGLRGWIIYLLKTLLARTTEMGSRTLVAAAVGKEDTHGQYMSDCEVRQPGEFVRSEEGAKTQERVYEELMEILEKIQPGITKNI